jgi:hypothetical protein
MADVDGDLPVVVNIGHPFFFRNHSHSQELHA